MQERSGSSAASKLLLEPDEQIGLMVPLEPATHLANRKVFTGLHQMSRPLVIWCRHISSKQESKCD